MRSPYETLGVPKDASDADIKKAYKEQALQWHPDRQEEEKREAAQEKFANVANAYEILKDPQKRQEFDTFGRVGQPGGGPGGPRQADAERIFREMFGAGGMEHIQRMQRQMQEQQMQARQQRLEELRRTQGLQPETEVRIRMDVGRLHRASRSSGIDIEYDERRELHAGKEATIVKCDHRDQSVKLRVMVSPGRAEELWYGADAVWDPQALEDEVQVRIQEDAELLHRASRAAGIGSDNDERRSRCAGKIGAITKVDLGDGSVKVRVLVGARSADELWFGFGAFEPVEKLPQAAIQDPAAQPAAGCGGGGGGGQNPFGGGSPFGGGGGSPFGQGGNPFGGGSPFGGGGRPGGGPFPAQGFS